MRLCTKHSGRPTAARGRIRSDMPAINQMQASEPAAGRLGTTIGRWASLSTIALVLAACGGGLSNPDSFASKALLGSSNPPPPIDISKLGPSITCPPITIQQGTESFSVYDGDQIGAFNTKHQANIVDTATECNAAGGTLTIKIGVRGRVLAGPKSSFGDVSLPLRVAVTKDGTEVVYSELHSITATLSEEKPSQPWATVIENIQISDQGTLRILLGFDDKQERNR